MSPRFTTASISHCRLLLVALVLAASALIAKPVSAANGWLYRADRTGGDGLQSSAFNGSFSVPGLPTIRRIDDERQRHAVRKQGAISHRDDDAVGRACGSPCRRRSADGVGGAIKGKTCRKSGHAPCVGGCAAGGRECDSAVRGTLRTGCQRVWIPKRANGRSY